MPDEGQSLLALAEQHGQRAATQLNRVCSVCTQAVKVGVSTNINTHAVLPVDESGHLPDLGSIAKEMASPTNETGANGLH